jgi:hypothetical protein
VDFNALVEPAGVSGQIQFLANGTAFDVEPLLGGQAIGAPSALPRGTNVIAANYSGDAYDTAAAATLLQVVTNHPPTAVPAYYTRAAGSTLVISIASLATNWYDVDGDSVSLGGVGVSTNGVVLSETNNTLVYSNANNVADQFVCTITDGWGGTNSQSVTITIALGSTTPRISSVIGNSSGCVTLNLEGASGYTYILEAATDLPASGNWLPMATNVLGAKGVWQFSDTSATNCQRRFYRLKLAQ